MQTELTAVPVENYTLKSILNEIPFIWTQQYNIYILISFDKCMICINNFFIKKNFQTEIKFEWIMYSWHFFLSI